MPEPPRIEKTRTWSKKSWGINPERKKRLSNVMWRASSYVVAKEPTKGAILLLGGPKSFGGLKGKAESRGSKWPED